MFTVLKKKDPIFNQVNDYNDLCASLIYMRIICHNVDIRPI